MDLVGPAGVVAEAVDHQRQVGVAALADRLAVVEGLELGQLVDVLLDQVGQLVHQPAAVAGVHLAPGAPVVERLAGGLDGQVDVGGVPSATSAITSSVAGLTVSNVLPLTLSRHWPSIRSLV